MLVDSQFNDLSKLAVILDDSRGTCLKLVSVF